MATNRKTLSFEDYETLLKSQERAHFYKIMELAQAGLDNCGICIFCQDCPRLSTCIIKKTCDEVEGKLKSGELERD
ncbi:MAG: hypothetical protein M0R48_08640 [Candidatus Omnitrophica bacterium]|jgi:3-hydroxy-3-methylglutaryl CoA synthase|nr:hypothetical protein [Candidatus Omnitrophota bacterium]